MFNQQRETKFVVAAQLSMPIELPLMILCCFAQLLASAAYIFGLLERYSKIATIKTGNSPSASPVNYNFLVKYYWTIMAFFSLACMIVEVILFVKKDILMALRSRIVRGLFYFFKPWQKSFLFDSAAKTAKGMGAASLRADTHPDNIPMQKSLERAGFKKCGRFVISEGDEAGGIRLAYERLL